MGLLEATILNGQRRGDKITLSLFSTYSSPSLWVREDEALEFELVLPNGYSNVTLQLYDHFIEPSYSSIFDDDRVKHVWKPKYQGRFYESLFFNYFGIAELSVSALDSTGKLDVLEFEPIEVLASKAKADDVESMIIYLSSLGEDKLHSLFQTTKFGAGYREGVGTPTSYLERLEESVEKIAYHVQQILRNPISKLTPQCSIIHSNGAEQLDDSSVSWLMDNLSVLEAVDSRHDSHILYGKQYYRASSLQVSNLKEDTNLYENEVVHAAILYLKQKSVEQLTVYKEISNKKRNDYTFPHGYVSFYSQISKLKMQLLGNQLSRCLDLIEKLGQAKLRLEKHLPVKKVALSRPMLTAKAASNVAYRSIFSEYILWLECNQPDWSLYKSLMAITSIPKLFELYTYYRVEEALHQLFSRVTTPTWDIGEVEVSLHYEPKYWMPKNNNVLDSAIINSEGRRIDKNGEIVDRSYKSRYSHRSPDIVIEICSVNELPRLIVLDAKYTSAAKSLTHYLPECTMKYVHGLSYWQSNSSAVDSMTILYPDEFGRVDSFHSDEYSLNGPKPVLPALQCLGVRLGEDRDDDAMSVTLKQLLKLSGIREFHQFENLACTIVK